MTKNVKIVLIVAGAATAAYLVYINFINTNAGTPGVSPGTSGDVDFGSLNPSAAW